MKKRIVTTTSVFQEGYPGEKAIDRLAALGFEALDMALDYCEEMPEFLGDGYLKWAADLRARAEAAGVRYTHAHAPGAAENNPHIARSLEIAGALGAKYIVLHPVCRDGEAVIDDAEAFIRRNADAVRPWLDKAKECGVVILSENLLWGASRDPRIIARLVREVDSEWFGWCYDTGHANCFGLRPEILEECVVAPLSLHLQDNHGEFDDEHLIPGDGTIDWDALVRSLKAVGYAGDCVLEAHHQSLEAPDEEREEILARLLEVARVLREKMK